jgi:hypothetical protein
MSHAILRRPLLFAAAAAFLAPPANAIMPMLPGIQTVSATSSTPSVVSTYLSIFTVPNSPFTSTFTNTQINVGDVFIWTVAIDGGDAIGAAALATASCSAMTVFQQRASSTNSSGSITTAMTVLWASVTQSTTSFSVVTTMGTGIWDDAVTIGTLVRSVLNPAAPFDPNPSLPFINGGFPPASATYSTSNSTNVGLFVYGGAAVPWIIPPPVVVAPASWVWAEGAENPGGHFVCDSAVYTQTTSVTLSAATVSVTTSINNSAIYYVDALTGNPGGVA